MAEQKQKSEEQKVLELEEIVEEPTGGLMSRRTV